jgi:hypothetical protein
MPAGVCYEALNIHLAGRTQNNRHVHIYPRLGSAWCRTVVLLFLKCYCSLVEWNYISHATTQVLLSCMGVTTVMVTWLKIYRNKELILVRH